MRTIKIDLTGATEQFVNAMMKKGYTEQSLITRALSIAERCTSHIVIELKPDTWIDQGDVGVQFHL
jgi:hypothetical protein